MFYYYIGHRLSPLTFKNKVCPLKASLIMLMHVHQFVTSRYGLAIGIELFVND